MIHSYNPKPSFMCILYKGYAFTIFFIWHYDYCVERLKSHPSMTINQSYKVLSSYTQPDGGCLHPSCVPVARF